jgi:hypothetical protein
MATFTEKTPGICPRVWLGGDDSPSGGGAVDVIPLDRVKDAWRGGTGCYENARLSYGASEFERARCVTAFVDGGVRAEQILLGIGEAV